MLVYSWYVLINYTKFSLLLRKVHVVQHGQHYPFASKNVVKDEDKHIQKK